MTRAWLRRLSSLYTRFRAPRACLRFPSSPMLPSSSRSPSYRPVQTRSPSWRQDSGKLLPSTPAEELEPQYYDALLPTPLRDTFEPEILPLLAPPRPSFHRRDSSVTTIDSRVSAALPLSPHICSNAPYRLLWIRVTQPDPAQR